MALTLGCGLPSETLELNVGGEDRSYRLFVPENLPAGPRPLVVALHGGGGTGKGMERFSNLDDVADIEGFLVAYPSGLSRGWNDGRVGEATEERRGVDDGEFLVAMIDEIASRYEVDPKRVYATGVSNGGFMSHTLANRYPERFAAIAPVIGGIAEPVAEAFGKGAVAVLIVQGTADPLVPYSGGEVVGGRGAFVDTRKAARMWAERNGCTPEPKEDYLPDADPGDGCRVRREMWSGGEAPVVLLTILGGGHTWPGGSQYLPEWMIGPVCRDFDGSWEIWKFFKVNARK